MNPQPFTGLRLPSHGPRLVAPFEVHCRCGNTLRGQRTTVAQTVTCSQCRTERFILPCSPLPPLASAAAGSASPAELRSFKRWPIAAAAIATFLVFVTFLSVSQFKRPADAMRRPRSVAEQLEDHRSAGVSALKSGSYERAAQELQRAVELAASVPDYAPNTPAYLQLRQENRQAAILADLLMEPLGQIIRNAVGVDADEWQQVFRRHYAGRSIILDDVIHLDPNGGRYSHQLRIEVLEKSGRIDLGPLDLLPYCTELNQPRRMFFGFRLEAIERDTSGNWRIVPAPKSGVLFTDPEILSGLSIEVDAELKEVLKRQAFWLDQIEDEARGGR